MGESFYGFGLPELAYIGGFLFVVVVHLYFMSQVLSKQKGFTPYKATWLIVLLIPIVGVVAYLFYGQNRKAADV